MTARLVLDPLLLATPRVLVDLTRLIRRRAQPFATGVDRIDVAIAQELRVRFREACGFVHAAAFGPALLPHAVGAALLDAVAARWRGDAPAAPSSALPALARGVIRRLPAAERAETTYVVASHSGLAQRRGALARLDPGARMRRLAYVHDLIPID
ncbi:hypothetical protein, partial [Rubrimonas sp.]|uniref:hypothetical protein n=1 Tax=Rubrimonas sp. TaxID=2036015 RepID=UPI003FA7A904